MRRTVAPKSARRRPAKGPGEVVVNQLFWETWCVVVIDMYLEPGRRAQGLGGLGGVVIVSFC